MKLWVGQSAKLMSKLQPSSLSHPSLWWSNTTLAKEPKRKPRLELTKNIYHILGKCQWIWNEHFKENTKGRKHRDLTGVHDKAENDGVDDKWSWCKLCWIFWSNAGSYALLGDYRLQYSMIDNNLHLQSSKLEVSFNLTKQPFPSMNVKSGRSHFSEIARCNIQCPCHNN